MVKTTYETASLAIPRKELISAVKKFVLDSFSSRELILADNVASPNFGSSDLLFVNKAKTSLTVVRLNSDHNKCEKFIISSIAYYLWLKEFMTVSEIFLDTKSKLDMYLFSRKFSAASRLAMDHFWKDIGVHLIRYTILRVDGLDEPGIYFERLTPEGPAQDKTAKKEGQDQQTVLTEEKQEWTPLKISAEELKEFQRLRKLHLT
jgi:hypothetical protein